MLPRNALLVVRDRSRGPLKWLGLLSLLAHNLASSNDHALGVIVISWINIYTDPKAETESLYIKKPRTEAGLKGGVRASLSPAFAVCLADSLSRRELVSRHR